jgi:hypothetical protein
MGHPPKHVSTSFVERQNWTVRATIRRYTRLSNGFSRKLANHAVATALNYFAYNFIKIHRTLRVSPVMASGVTDRLWSVEDLVALWEAYEQRRTERQVAWEIPMIRLPILKDELDFLEKLLPDMDARPDLGHLAIDIKRRIEKIRQEIRALERDQNSK